MKKVPEDWTGLSLDGFHHVNELVDTVQKAKKIIQSARFLSESLVSDDFCRVCQKRAVDGKIEHHPKCPAVTLAAELEMWGVGSLTEKKDG
jgi:hypothetical protein